MAENVRVAEGAIQRGADIVSSSRVELRRELDALQGRLASLPSRWKGLGSVAFTSLMERWQGDATRIIAALDEFEAQLLGSQKSYDESDEAAQASMNTLTARLG